MNSNGFIIEQEPDLDLLRTSEIFYFSFTAYPKMGEMLARQHFTLFWTLEYLDLERDATVSHHGIVYC